MTQQTEALQAVEVAAPPATRRRWRGSKRSTVAGVTGLLLLSGTAAFAYWTTGGTGTATGTAGTTTPVAITGTVAGPIYPGGNFAVSFTADNPNNSAVRIGTISATGFDTDSAGCDTLIANATFTDFSMANVVANEVIEANANDEVIAAAGSLVFGNSPSENQDACKGATLTITLSASAAA